jgi:hypothetical protein
MNPYIGKKFNNLTIVDKLSTKHKSGGFLYLCRCDCGNEIQRPISWIKIGNTKSCGCRRVQKARSLPGEVSFNAKYKTYKKNAERRKIEFVLKYEIFKCLVSQNCIYCDSVPEAFNYYLNCDKRRHYSFSTDETIKNAQIIANGIDRIANDKGYTNFNSVPCCTTCNFGKHGLTLKEWLEYLNRFDKEIHKKFNSRLARLREKIV